MSVKNNFTNVITTTSIGLLGRLNHASRATNVSSRNLNVSARLVKPMSRSREVSVSVSSFTVWSPSLPL